MNQRNRNWSGSGAMLVIGPGFPFLSLNRLAPAPGVLQARTSLPVLSRKGLPEQAAETGISARLLPHSVLYRREKS
jgi:hypothetical protein